LKSQGYRIELLFLWLPSADTAVERVGNRVLQGGHAVPVGDIRRRFAAGLNNLFSLYRPILDSWWLYDASTLPPKLIAEELPSGWTVKDSERYEQFQRLRRAVHE